MEIVYLNADLTFLIRTFMSPTEPEDFLFGDKTNKNI